MKSLRTSAFVAALLALAAATPASAQLRGQSGCKISTPADIAFGTYVDGQSSPAHTASVIQVTCKGNAIVLDVALTAGPGTNSGDPQERRLAHRDGDFLRYQLYVDSARTRVWGDGTRGTEAIVLATPGRTKVATVYGEMPGGQWGAEGDYDDQIVITVLP